MLIAMTVLYKSCTHTQKKKTNYLRFAAILAHEPTALLRVDGVRALVQLERPLPAEAAIAVRTAKRLLRIGQMRLPV